MKNGNMYNEMITQPLGSELLSMRKQKSLKLETNIRQGY